MCARRHAGSQARVCMHVDTHRHEYGHRHAESERMQTFAFGNGVVRWRLS